jgi:hypothetical protein
MVFFRRIFRVFLGLLVGILFFFGKLLGFFKSLFSVFLGFFLRVFWWFLLQHLLQHGFFNGEVLS